MILENIQDIHGQKMCCIKNQHLLRFKLFNSVINEKMVKNVCRLFIKYSFYCGINFRNYFTNSTKMIAGAVSKDVW